VAALGLVGCDGLLKNDELPPNVADPALTLTPKGALAAYRGTQSLFRSTFGGEKGSVVGSFRSFVPLTGILSDELNPLESSLVPEDIRMLSEPGDYVASGGAYGDLQMLRGQAGQAIGLLTRYVPENPELAGHVYALQGYAELFLAELFCSGIPLSTLDFNGNFTYHAGSTTDAVFLHAAALFDTAVTLAGDSTRFVALAQMGKGRALLGLGAYAEAAAAVAAVPDAYRYTVT
jgi:hypothetical protein